MIDRRLLRAEWIKLTTVRSWTLGLVAAAAVTVMFSLLVASGSGTDVNNYPVVTGPDGQRVVDDFHFVHQPLAGDGSITARVLTQSGVDEHGESRPPEDWAKAGVMIKESAEGGSPYAAMMITAGNGIRMQSNFTTDIAGSDEASPRWLRLSRSGSTLTGYESADGRQWSEVGAVDLSELPETVEVGFFVASPPEVVVERQAGSTSVGELSTQGIATFDNVTLESEQSQRLRPWSSDDIGNSWSVEPAAEINHIFTVSGSGDIAADPPDDDVVQISLTGVLVGSLAIAAVSVLFITSEYKRGMIRTTFAASPRRRGVLVAKALVAGAITFVVGLVASVAAFFLAQPMLRDNGFAPPAFPEPSLSDGSVLRAVVGSAALLAMVAVLSVGIGAIVRRSAAAIAGFAALFFVPAFVATALSPTAAEWLVRLTPAAGLAIQRSLEPTNALVEPWSMIEPWAGFGVLCIYAGAALAGAAWLLQRRDA